MTLQVPGEQVPASAASRFAYDVFVVYADADEAFVNGYLLPKLGLPPERVLQLQALELGRFVAKAVDPKTGRARFKERYTREVDQR